jgi:hypothetical protein
MTHAPDDGPRPLFEFISLGAPQPPAPAPPEAPLADPGLADSDSDPSTDSDPWAHRRGEPRLFAFFWTFYVLLAVAGSVTWLARAGVVTPGTYGPAARIMLVAVGVGMVVLWPMTRLSQASPDRNPILSTLFDLAVVQLPLQMVIWPLYVLASWPKDIVYAVSALMGAWGVLAGGLLALALAGKSVTMIRDPRLSARAAWMVLFLALVLAGPLARAVLDSRAQGAAAPEWLPMASPITAIAALTGHGLIGPGAPVSVAQWDAIVGTLSAGVFVWALAAARRGLSAAR